MASRVEINEPMVQRFYKWLTKDAGRRGFDLSAKDVWEMLEATLNPPEEPEIPVSYAMVAAGVDWLGKGRGCFDIDVATQVYRAMHRVALEEQKARVVNPAYFGGSGGKYTVTFGCAVHNYKPYGATGGGGMRPTTMDKCEGCGHIRTSYGERRKNTRRTS